MRFVPQEFDVYTALADSRHFLILGKGVQPGDIVPHHTRIFLGRLDRRASGIALEDTAALVGADPDKLRLGLAAGRGYLVYRRPREV